MDFVKHLLALLTTAVAGGLWALGREDPICIVFWLGMMIGWAFVFGDDIPSLHDVSGVITLISLIMNGLFGIIIGSTTGYNHPILETSQRREH